MKKNKGFTLIELLAIIVILTIIAVITIPIIINAIENSKKGAAIASARGYIDAVEKHQLPWLHVYNPRNSDIATKYAIEGYPTKIVVDPQGIIARVVIGEDPEFYTYLDSLFK
jgi:prepilin-type N-terminal cleavage/methylation domain-containing protein